MTPTTATNPTRSRFIPDWRTCFVPSASVLAVLCLLFDSPVPAARAAETGRNNSNGPAVGGTGAVEGRVFNLGTGAFLERARVTIEGTSLETFTDNLGQYLFPFVPAGQARVKAFYTGLVVQTAPVAVLAGQRTQQDFNLAGLGKELPADDGTVKLSQFVVSTSKEMDGAAIAINEQRFASNIRNVIAADEFGPVAEGNVGELLKFIPGVTIDYVAGDARTISLNGVPSDNVPVTVNGFTLASAQGTTRRNVELIFVSTNNISRIEVVYSPTPESPGSALAGSINMVPRSAFDRSKPIFNASAYLLMRDNERDFKKTPGPRNVPTRKVHPGFDFSYIAPVNKRFGYTVSAGISRQYQPLDSSQSTWRGAGAPTNGGTLPDTTPDRPYLSDYIVRVAPSQATRSSIGATLDYKLSRYDRLSFSFQGVFFNFLPPANRSLTFSVNRVLPGDFSTTFTHGFPGAGEVRLTNSIRARVSASYMPTLVYRHDGPIWRAEAGLGYSRSTTRFRDLAKGFFNNTLARRTGVTVSFDDIFYLRPRVITVTDAATGAPVDPYDINSYALATAGGNSDDTLDLQRTAYTSLGRDFAWRVPVSLKGGLDLRHSLRDFRGLTTPFTFVGADGRPTTTPTTPGSDDGAGVVLDESFSRRVAPFGFPRIQWVDNEKLWNYYNERPSSFTINQDGAYRSTVNLSKHAEEVISSAYLRGDVQFFDRRLKFVGGLRAEQTNVTAEGPLTDPTRNFQRDAGGKPLLGPNGRPRPITTDPLSASRLTIIDRGLQAEKEYLRLFPNLNASFNLRENLIARAAYYYSVGRPNFNQYAGGLTLPDTESPPSPGNRITVNNAGIKVWSARTTKVALEYYFERVGLFSVGAFRRDFENFFGSTIFNATPEFLSLYGLDPSVYGQYDVATQYNIPSTVRMEGVEFNYKQALTFLPSWARGVQVFANGSAQRATGDATSNFNHVPRTGSWGVSLTRPKYTLRMNWNYRGRQRLSQVAAGRSIDSATYNWYSERLFLDLTGEYNFRKKFALFANLRNFNNATEDLEVANPFMPAHAQFRQRQDFGSLWTFGVKSTF